MVLAGAQLPTRATAEVLLGRLQGGVGGAQAAVVAHEAVRRAGLRHDIHHLVDADALDAGGNRLGIGFEHEVGLLGERGVWRGGRQAGRRIVVGRDVQLVDPDRLGHAVPGQQVRKGLRHPVGVGGGGIDVRRHGIEVVAVGGAGRVGGGGVQHLAEELRLAGVGVPVEGGAGDDDLRRRLRLLDRLIRHLQQLVVGRGIAGPGIEGAGRIPDVRLIPDDPTGDQPAVLLGHLAAELRPAVARVVDGQGEAGRRRVDAGGRLGLGPGRRVDQQPDDVDTAGVVRLQLRPARRRGRDPVALAARLDLRPLEGDALPARPQRPGGVRVGVRLGDAQARVARHLPRRHG